MYDENRKKKKIFDHESAEHQLRGMKSNVAWRCLNFKWLATNNTFEEKEEKMITISCAFFILTDALRIEFFLLRMKPYMTQRFCQKKTFSSKKSKIWIWKKFSSNLKKFFLLSNWIMIERSNKFDFSKRKEEILVISVKTPWLQ